MDHKALMPRYRNLMRQLNNAYKESSLNYLTLFTATSKIKLKYEKNAEMYKGFIKEKIMT